MTPRRAAAFFLPPPSIKGIHKITGGNVNDTYLLSDISGKRFLLQRINPDVFPNPEQIMDNLEILLNHIGGKGRNQSKNNGKRREEIILYPTAAGEKTVRDNQGGLWRLMGYIGNAHTKNRITTSLHAAEIGRALGRFHHRVSALDPDLLWDTLPGFHIAPLYLTRYDQTKEIKTDSTQQNKDMLFCRNFINHRRQVVHILEQAKHEGRVRQQVIHGDPKPANFLFDNESNQVVALIDLDTVKSGLLLYDIGDCLRSCSNTAGEEIEDPAEVFFDVELCRAALEGYFAEAGSLLGKGDIQLIFEAVHLLTFELGIRFFTDYLAGNRYFKIRYSEHNLKRALVQFYLVASIETREKKIRGFAAGLCH